MFDRSKLWAIGLLLASFVAGVAVGSAANALLGERAHERDGGPRPGRSRQEVSYLDRLDRDLELSTGQRDSVAAILQRYDEPMRELWRRERHQVDSMRLQVRSQIAGLLDERQREQFQLMNQRVDSLRTVRERGGASRGR
ncbi:MAG: hypothetical protein HYT81_07280 [Gemmatimonadetes bacterium]|nr:hypothetical protein [Gemmatimonadota bacterium]